MSQDIFYTKVCFYQMVIIQPSSTSFPIGFSQRFFFIRTLVLCPFMLITYHKGMGIAQEAQTEPLSTLMKILNYLFQF